MNWMLHHRLMKIVEAKFNKMRSIMMDMMVINPTMWIIATTEMPTERISHTKSLQQDMWSWVLLTGVLARLSFMGSLLVI